MTDDGILCWVELLASTDAKRLEIIRDLLAHADEQDWDDVNQVIKRDAAGNIVKEMSAEDKAACLRAIQLLTRRQVREAICASSSRSSSAPS